MDAARSARSHDLRDLLDWLEQPLWLSDLLASRRFELQPLLCWRLVDERRQIEFARVQGCFGLLRLRLVELVREARAWPSSAAWGHLVQPEHQVFVVHHLQGALNLW